MELRLDTEDWREELNGSVAAVELLDGDGDGTDLNDWADRLCQLTLEGLTERGVEWERAYQQSVGAFCIIQRADDDERVQFDECLHEARTLVDEEIRTVVSKMAE